MTIRIIEDESEIVLTRSEHERLMREWQASQQMTTMPQDFESWLRNRRLYEQAVRTFVTTPQILPRTFTDGGRVSQLPQDGRTQARRPS